MNQRTVLINPFLFSQTLIKLWEQVNYEETLFSTACPVSMPTVKWKVQGVPQLQSAAIPHTTALFKKL